MMFADAHTFVTYDLLFWMRRTDPAVINRGNCEEWAERMALWVGGCAVWLDTLIDVDEFSVDDMPNIAHCVLEWNGRYYDSEHPNGVDDILELAR